MNRITGKIQFALVAVFASAALTAWGITITLNDGTNSAVCIAGDGATIASNGDITASVSASANCTLGGGGGGGGGTGPWTLTVTKSGSGAGSVSSDPAGITNCAATCSAPFNDGTAVTLTASVGANSAFGGWGGAGAACGTNLTCLITMNAAKTVTATFNSTGGGGGDPGPGTNPWVNGSNYVHNRGSLTELYVPRCVPNQYSNCRQGGQQSQYDSLLVGQVWSMRLPFGQTTSTATYNYTIARSETGESLTAFDQTISTIPGDFSAAIPANCKRMNAVDAVLKVHDSTAMPNPPNWLGSCPLSRNTMYYINVRPAAGTPGETQCGTGAGKGCRYKIILPNVPAGFYTN